MDYKYKYLKYKKKYLHLKGGDDHNPTICNNSNDCENDEYCFFDKDYLDQSGKFILNTGGVCITKNSFTIDNIFIEFADIDIEIDITIKLEILNINLDNFNVLSLKNELKKKYRFLFGNLNLNKYTQVM